MVDKSQDVCVYICRWNNCWKLMPIIGLMAGLKIDGEKGIARSNTTNAIYLEISDYFLPQPVYGGNFCADIQII